MQSPLNEFNRRAFLGNALKIGTGSLLVGASSKAGAAPKKAKLNKSSAPLVELPELPVRVLIQHEGKNFDSTTRQGSRFTSKLASVILVNTPEGREVRVTCPTGLLSRVVLRWEVSFTGDTLFLGDQWERGYGDLQWRYLQPERIMPWYFAAHQTRSEKTFMLGVKTQPSSLCFWTVDASGISLWLDFRNGGDPSKPGDREIPAATILSLSSISGESPMSALTRFCKLLCPKPRLAPAPICGNNNWYYSYGRNFDAEAMRRDAGFLAELAAGHANLPYCVIDAGWTLGSVCPGGPWVSGDAKRFPDMAGLASDMRKQGVRAGIWMRPTALMKVDEPRRLRQGHIKVEEKPLDLTLPENLELIRSDVARVHGWGYDLIKHDFSTFDVFGKWGFEMGAELTEDKWHFNDQTLTNAEIILRLYRILREGAGEAILLGCNTIGHLGAGLFEIQRTGDDVSGRVWERTRRMGVNTLAFRLPQHRTFFASDCDCAVHTEFTPWELDRQFLDLLARSGTALFVSADPRTIQPEQKAAFYSAMQTALSGGTPGGCEPLDWLHNTAPCVWRIGDERVTYDWGEPFGASPFKI